MSATKTLKDAMDEWDREDAVRFIHNLHSSQQQTAVGPFYNLSGVAVDILSRKINILAELGDQEIDRTTNLLEDKLEEILERTVMTTPLALVKLEQKLVEIEQKIDLLLEEIRK